MQLVIWQKERAEGVIKSAMAKKLKQFEGPITSGPDKCLVYMFLQWLGPVPMKCEKQVRAPVTTCFFVVKPPIIFKTKKLLPATKKNVLPAQQQSNVIYEFSCHCNSRYVGRTSEGLQDRINQYVSKSIRNTSSKQMHASTTCLQVIYPYHSK